MGKQEGVDALYGEERKKVILDYIQNHGRASVQELTEIFQVSESTIRRDLKELEEARLLKRTHGGALSLQSVNFEPTLGEKEITFLEEKRAIAKKALELIREGDTILLDAGTTTFELAKQLKSFSKLVVVTNAVNIFQELITHPGIELIIIGGTLRKETLAMVGPMAEQALSMIRVDKLFLATNGLDVEAGLTTPNLIEAATKRKMINIAKQVILLADHSKVGVITQAKITDVNEIHQIILDDAADEHFIKQLKTLGIKVHLVYP
ncbi:transcriptional regulator, DeoR family [Desulfotomaculum nigrificans CO-1-SRB]|uniref:Transcriptional regulator, DeoR family n=1 Tax=Desulfotomaculum nigrificans (strain DSM 14880 / VKM B-2319 / CO-1-SRB) TaxID=868595 RepID=F6B697_DESCC|nr:transcriptional regulator, DeoR family [Desulfotomaculum nigrificans CO-1-SRB]